jgi:hypothetical protein
MSSWGMAFTLMVATINVHHFVVDSVRVLGWKWVFIKAKFFKRGGEKLEIIIESKI